MQTKDGFKKAAAWQHQIEMTDSVGCNAHQIE
jgi:hypothetical protein